MVAVDFACTVLLVRGLLNIRPFVAKQSDDEWLQKNLDQNAKLPLRSIACLLFVSVFELVTVAR